VTQELEGPDIRENSKQLGEGFGKKTESTDLKGGTKGAKSRQEELLLDREAKHSTRVAQPLHLF